MARRMFSPAIVGSDAFLDMPVSSQVLYFHLGMYADDDGFVNPKRIMRMVGVGEDDLRVLIGKRFVLNFESGVVVIKHWKINNLVRKDWYKETQYAELKEQLTLKPNGAYTELVNEMLTNRHRRLGKVRLGNTSEPSSQEKENNMPFNKYGDDYMEEDLQIDPDHKPKKKEKKVADEVQQVFDLFDNPAKAIWKLREIEREAAKALYETYGLEKLTIRMKRIESEKQKKDPYFPEVNTPSQLLDKMPNVERYLNL